MSINYELVYKMRPYQERVFSSRVEIRGAEKKARILAEEFRKALARNLDVSQADLDFDCGYSCIALGIDTHVLHNGTCVFCGCLDPRKELD